MDNIDVMRLNPKTAMSMEFAAKVHQYVGICCDLLCSRRRHEVDGMRENSLMAWTA